MAEEYIKKLPDNINLDQIKDEWTAIGKATDPIDQGKAKEAVVKAYKCAGWAKPKLWTFHPSPFAGAMAAALISTEKFDKLFAATPEEAKKIGKGEAKAKLAESEDAKAFAEVARKVWKDFGRKDKLSDSTIQYLYESTKPVLSQYAYSGAYGCQDAYWLAFYWVFRGLVPEVDKMEGLFDCAKTSGWWWPFEGAVVVTDKPSEIHLDGQGRLHNPDGFAVSYRDGWGLYAIGGVIVDEKIIKVQFTSEDIDNQQNLEVKRIMIDKYGMEKYIRSSGTRKIGSAPDPTQPDKLVVLYGKKWVNRQREGEEERELKLVCVINGTPEQDGTFKEYFIPVPSAMMDPIEAVAWTYGLTKEEYSQGIRRRT